MQWLWRNDAKALPSRRNILLPLELQPELGNSNSTYSNWALTRSIPIGLANSNCQFGLNKFDNAVSADWKSSRVSSNACIILVYIVIVSVEEFDEISPRFWTFFLVFSSKENEIWLLNASTRYYHFCDRWFLNHSRNFTRVRLEIDPNNLNYSNWLRIVINWNHSNRLQILINSNWLNFDQFGSNLNGAFSLELHPGSSSICPEQAIHRQTIFRTHKSVHHLASGNGSRFNSASANTHPVWGGEKKKEGEIKNWDLICFSSSFFFFFKTCRAAGSLSWLTDSICHIHLLLSDWISQPDKEGLLFD